MNPRSQQSQLLGQFARFGIAGGAVALLSVAAYWLAAVRVGWPPLLANLLSYLVSLVCGFHAHRRWSFRGAGGCQTRYAIVSCFAFLMNSLWIWLLTVQLGSPNWVPILPMLIVTPLLTFALGRFWVFERASRGDTRREALTLFP